MPVPRVGISPENPVFSGVKRRNCENVRTLLVLDNCIQSHFGALMIGCTITG